MFELREIWNNSRQDEEELLSRVCLYALPSAAIFNADERASYAALWRDRYEAAKERLDIDISDVKQFERCKLMQEYALITNRILNIFSDVILPGTFEEFIAYGFDGRFGMTMDQR